MEAPCPEIEVFDDLTQDRSTSMTDQAISPLRRRMIEDMTIRKFVAKTQHDYVQRVKDFAVFLGRSPSTASKEDVRRRPGRRRTSAATSCTGRHPKTFTPPEVAVWALMSALADSGHFALRAESSAYVSHHPS